MARTNEKAAPARTGTALENVIGLAARDGQIGNPSPLHLQQKCLRRRFGLAPEIAVLVAGLAYGEARV